MQELAQRIWFLLLSKVGLNSSFPSDIKASGILLGAEIHPLWLYRMVLISCRNSEIQKTSFYVTRSERVSLHGKNSVSFNGDGITAVLSI